MPETKLLKHLYPAVVFLLGSCAQIVAPTGGDKDFTSPKVVSTSPENKTTRFDKKKITVQFDEFIQLNTPEDLIIISPPTETKPVYTNKGKALEIKFTSPLQANTTYTINFSTAVGDNKENNLLKDYNYVFSTGSNLDSGLISGDITNAFTNKPEKDITVALYYPDSFSDSTALKYKPVYLAKTDERGTFRITNLPATDFILLAFRDENRNLKAEHTEEKGFIKQSVRAADTGSVPLPVKLFKPDVYKPGHIIDTLNKEPDKFVLVMYKPKASAITNTTNGPTYIKHINSLNFIDTFYVFTQMNTGDSLVKLQVNDKIIPIRYKSIFKTQKLVYSFNKQPELNDTIRFVFNNPVLQADTSRIRLFKDSTQLNPVHLFTDPFEYKLVYNWAEKTGYRLEVKDSAFVDLFKQYSKRDKALFTSKTLKDYATLTLHVKISAAIQTPIILQIIDETEAKVYYQFIIRNSRDINLDYVLPGNYKIKYIYDSNDNGEWDNGDYLNKIQPERIGYFKEPINIKAYWDLEQSILIE